MRVTFCRCLFFFLLIFFFQVKAQMNSAAKPWVFWYWIQAGVSKEGITADLEAMKSNGIAGAYLMTIKGENSSNPPLYQPASNQLSSRWWEMVKFAFSEAKRLDLKLGMHISDGFALAGGPWISPELSMQKLVSSKLTIKGGKRVKIKLPQPKINESYYQDIAVYAYPLKAGTSESTDSRKPKVTTSNGLDGSALVDPANKQNFISADPIWIQYDFGQSFTCRSITIKTPGNNYQANRLKISVSDDGLNFKSIGQLEAPRHGWQDADEDYTHSIATTRARYFRFYYDKNGSEPGAEDLDAAKWKQSLKLLNIKLSAKPKIGNIEGKNGSIWRIASRTTSSQIPKILSVPLSSIKNISQFVDKNGNLNWTAPSGTWVVLRIGHTSTGQRNATGGAAIGLECDKFNPAAISVQFNNWYGEALRQAGPEIASKVLNTFHVDSWECGSQNWSPVFKKEFLKRRGYSIEPYLPIMTGLPVESVETSENFLYDVRKTIAELIVDQFYGTLAKLAKEKGVTFTAESVAPTMLSDGLLHYKNVNIPMGEFWLNSPTHDKPNDMLDAISGAHIYGKPIVQAEAFTTVRMDWNESPMNMKMLQDRNYALGINKLAYHVFTHNPWTDRKPGMTLDGVGLYFQRDQTWWKAGKAWVEYAERCQYWLQQGSPVTDIAVFIGEELPRRAVLPDRLVPILPGIFGDSVVISEQTRLANKGQTLRQIPSGVTHSANMPDAEDWVNPLRGYAYDSFNPDVLSNARVENGKVVFESGATYKLLIFPAKTRMNPNAEFCSYQTLTKIIQLVEQGASIIVEERPKYQSGLKQVDNKLYENAINQIFGGHIQQIGSLKLKQLGKGKIFFAPVMEDSFKAYGIEPDLVVTENSSKYAEKVAYTHRSTTSTDIYFVANQVNAGRNLSLEFRQSKKSAIIYDPVQNRYFKPKFNASDEKEKKLRFTHFFAPQQSFFIIITDSTSSFDLSSGDANLNTLISQDLSAEWNVKFDPEFGGPIENQHFVTLTDWTKTTDSTIRYYSGSAIYEKKFIVSNDFQGKQIFLDLGGFSSIAEVELNGVNIGTLWTPPFQLPIAAALKSGENVLRIKITNTWANRLIGDQLLPEDKRITKTTAPFRLAGKPLNPAGLFGPVVLKIKAP